ncbi:uncharacterized protein ATNIH1004_008045 [Aspergillus tanneri]|uniref:CCHC-type domain-containing protein n=1 Tax=Aspergillus tanneri TaxID=1220188 RepID=A0A5M9MI01_9EURO|nr:uncharacterized protein ATNIH1004_008045 [Aspergillus tanneri]KAA8646612.1 hypothetical protein ATNIH1004_008045 [Aspergillus tanneri]
MTPDNRITKTCGNSQLTLTNGKFSSQKHTQKINERITSGQESSKTCDMKRLNTTNEPETYEGYIAHLQTIEDSIPGRRKEISQAKNRRSQHSLAMRHRTTTPGNTERQQPSSQRGPDKPWRGNNRAFRGNSNRSQGHKRQQSHNPDIECYVCGEKGHIAPQCPKPAALGLEEENPKDNAIETMVELQAQERTIPTCVNRLGVSSPSYQPKVRRCAPPGACNRPAEDMALDGHRIRCYGRYRLRATTQDCHGVRRTIERTFDVVDMDHYDAILGYPWLREANPNVDWELGTWEYRKIPPEKEVEIINEAEVNRTYERENKSTQRRNPCGFCDIGEGVRIPAIYKEFEDVFSEENAGILPAHADHDHAIDIQPGKEPHTDQFTPCPKVSSQFCADILKQR